MTKFDRFNRGQVAVAFLVVPFMIVAALSFVAPAQAAEPAVKALNGQVIGFFNFAHADSETTHSSIGGVPARLFPEEDTESGGLTGIITAPVGDSLGVRFFVSPNFSQHNVPGFSEVRTGGIATGGDIFWRDPNVGEISAGPRYEWSFVEPGGGSFSAHAVGVNGSGKIFLADFGFGPVDLGLGGSFLDSEIENSRLRSANVIAGKGQSFYSVGGSLVLYPIDSLALGAKGGWARQNFGSRGHIITSSGGFFMDLLLPYQPAVTLGANLNFGEQEISLANFSTAGRLFYQLGLSLTISFPGAKSLVELERNYY